MQFNSLFIRKLVEVAKRKAEREKYFDVLEEFREKGDVMGAWVLGLVVGMSLGLNADPFAVVTVSNFNNLVRRLRSGESEEKLIEELEMVRKKREFEERVGYL